MKAGILKISLAFIFFTVLSIANTDPAVAGQKECDADPTKCCWSALGSCNTVDKCDSPDRPICQYCTLLGGCKIKSDGDNVGCFADEAMQCVSCLSNEQCAAKFPNLPYCNGASCVECDSSAGAISGQCPIDRPVCSNANQCVRCTDDIHCGGGENKCVNNNCIEITPTCAAPGDECNAVANCCNVPGQTVSCNSKPDGKSYCELDNPDVACNCGNDNDCSADNGEICKKDLSGSGSLCDETTVGPGIVYNGLCIVQNVDVTIDTYSCAGPGGTCTKDPSGPYTNSNCNGECTALIGGTAEPTGPFPNFLDPKELLNFITIAAGILAVFASGYKIAVGGYLLLTSGADPTKLQEGKETLTSAFIGFIFAILGIAMLRFIIATFVGYS